MEILGLIFAGTATAQRPAMARFVADVLGLEPIAGAGADFFAMPDGTTFAVAGPRGGGEESRTIGFLVADLDAAIAELSAAGVEVDDPAGNERQHRTAVADRLAGDELGRPRALERVVVELDLGMLGQQRAQLVLERVVVGVDQLGHAARVEPAVPVDLLGKLPGLLFHLAHGPELRESGGPSAYPAEA